MDLNYDLFRPRADKELRRVPTLESRDEYAPPRRRFNLTQHGASPPLRCKRCTGTVLTRDQQCYVRAGS